MHAKLDHSQSCATTHGQVARSAGASDTTPRHMPTNHPPGWMNHGHYCIHQLGHGMVITFMALVGSWLTFPAHQVAWGDCRHVAQHSQHAHHGLLAIRCNGMEWKMVKQDEINMWMMVLLSLGGWELWWMWQDMMQDEEGRESWHGSMHGDGWR